MPDLTTPAVVVAPKLFNKRMQRMDSATAWQKRFGNLVAQIDYDQKRGLWCGFLAGAHPEHVVRNRDQLHVRRAVENQLRTIADAIGKARNA